MSWPKKVNFEDNTNPYPGAMVDPGIVADGHTSSSYAMSSGTDINKRWDLKNSTYSWISQVKAISFWHRGTTGSTYPVAMIAHTNETITNWNSGSWLYLGMNLNSPHQYYLWQNSTTSRAKKWYINGVDAALDLTYTGNVYKDATLNTWNHHYIEFETTMNRIVFLNVVWSGSPTEADPGKLDDIYFFNEVQTTDTIADLSNNTFGVSPYPGVSFTDVLSVRAIDLSSTDIVPVSAVPTTWFNNLEGTGDTLERNKETRRNNLITEIFTANSTKTFFDISKSVINLPENSIKESTRIFKVDSTSNKATVNLNTETTLNDEKGFYVPLIINEKVEITSKDGNITFQIERTGLGSDGKATYTVTKTAGTSKLIIDA